jgi:hypothetical protein
MLKINVLMVKGQILKKASKLMRMFPNLFNEILLVLIQSLFINKLTGTFLQVNLLIL